LQNTSITALKNLVESLYYLPLENFLDVEWQIKQVKKGMSKDKHPFNHSPTGRFL